MTSNALQLASICTATLGAGVGSVWLAAKLVGKRPADGSGQLHHLLSLAAGALLATAFMHLLPEAFDSTIAPSTLFAVLLGGLLFFFLLDKAELWHHSHEHSQIARPHSHGQSSSHSNSHSLSRQSPQLAVHPSHGSQHRTGAWAVLLGDSVHCFSDGVLIASAFLADMKLGLIAAVAVLAHEVPHHIGDIALLSQTSGSSRAAEKKVMLAGSVTLFGGIAGWLLLDKFASGTPYFLVVAGSSFVYVALADLMPQLQRQLKPKQAGLQVLWLGTGIAAVTIVSHLGDVGHGHIRTATTSEARLADKKAGTAVSLPSQPSAIGLLEPRTNPATR